MRIKQRRILAKIYRLNQKLLPLLPYEKQDLIQQLYTNYHNSVNTEILKKEIQNAK